MIFLLEDDDDIRELVVYSLCKTGTPAEGFDRPSAFFAALKEQGIEITDVPGGAKWKRI